MRLFQRVGAVLPGRRRAVPEAREAQAPGQAGPGRAEGGSDLADPAPAPPPAATTPQPSEATPEPDLPDLDLMALLPPELRRPIAPPSQPAPRAAEPGPGAGAAPQPPGGEDAAPGESARPAPAPAAAAVPESDRPAPPWGDLLGPALEAAGVEPGPPAWADALPPSHASDDGTAPGGGEAPSARAFDGAPPAAAPSGEAPGPDDAADRPATADRPAAPGPAAGPPAFPAQPEPGSPDPASPEAPEAPALEDPAPVPAGALAEDRPDPWTEAPSHDPAPAPAGPRRPDPAALPAEGGRAMDAWARGPAPVAAASPSSGLSAFLADGFRQLDDRRAAAPWLPDGPAAAGQPAPDLRAGRAAAEPAARPASASGLSAFLADGLRHLDAPASSTPEHAGPRPAPAPAPAAEAARRPPQDGAPVLPAQPSLAGAAEIAGLIGACLVDSDSGLVLASEGRGLDHDAVAALSTQVVRAEREVIEQLRLDDRIEDILITMGRQLHVIRPLERMPTVFLYLALDRRAANLGMARMQLGRIERGLAG